MEEKPIRLLRLHGSLSEREMSKQQEKIGEVGVKASIGQMQGNYCNVAVIQHTKREFVFDYILRVGNDSVFVSRIITSPEHAKAIYNVLGKNIGMYEKKFGKIEEDKKLSQASQGGEKEEKPNRLIRRRRPF